MSQWNLVSLSEVCQIKPPKKEAKAKLSDTDLVSFVPMSNLGIYTKRLWLDKDRQLKKVYGSYTYFADNDVLLAKITPCFENGKLGIAQDLTNSIGFGSSEFIVFRSKGELDPEYLFYFLSQDTFREAGAEVMTGAVGHKRVPKEFIENQKIPLPPLPEQKRIVAILDEVFEGIAQTVATTENNLANARELFESYLNSVFTQKGEGREESSIGESCDFFNGKAHEKKIDADGQFIVINSKFISSNGKSFKRTNDALFPLYKNDIVMVMSDVPNGKALAKCFLIDGNGIYTLNQRICCIRSEKFEKRFLFHHLNRHPFLLSFNNGENQTNLRKGDILRCPLFIPEINEQRKIAILLDGLLLETNHLESIYQQKLEALSELKQSILQKAFTGDLTNDAAN